MDSSNESCLICERPLPGKAQRYTNPRWFHFKCGRCGPYFASELGRLGLKYREDDTEWSAEERARLSGVVRARSIRGEDPPKFGYYDECATNPELDSAEKLLGAAPQTFSRQVDQTLLNLSQIKGRGEVIQLGREEDISIAYAKNNAELEMVLTDLEDEGYLQRTAETRGKIDVQITGRGWRKCEEMTEPGTADITKVTVSQGDSLTGDQTNPSPPKAFISYSWDSDDHKKWTKDLSARLRGDGVDVKLDQWETVPGDRLPEFMERAIRENDYVLIVCTPTYRVKSDKREGGVGYEGDIMTGELHTQGDHRKFIPILRLGDWDTSLPSWLKGKFGIDLHGDPYSDDEYKRLRDTLHGRLPKRPPLGEATDFTDNGTANEEGDESDLGKSVVTAWKALEK